MKPIQWNGTLIISNVRQTIPKNTSYQPLTFARLMGMGVALDANVKTIIPPELVNNTAYCEGHLEAARTGGVNFILDFVASPDHEKKEYKK